MVIQEEFDDLVGILFDFSTALSSFMRLRGRAKSKIIETKLLRDLSSRRTNVKEKKASGLRMSGLVTGQRGSNGPYFDHPGVFFPGRSSEWLTVGVQINWKVLPWVTLT